MKDNRTVYQKKEEFLEAMKTSMGIKSLAARKAKIGRTMLYEYISKDLDFALKVQAFEEAGIDFAEGKLCELVALGDRAAIMFYLKAKARSRGYY